MRHSIMILMTLCVVALAPAQPPETNDNVPNGSPRRHGSEFGSERPPPGRLGFASDPMPGGEAAPGDGPGSRHGGFFRDMSTSGSNAGFRPLMLSEISHLPLLESKVKAMLEIQQERFAIQRDRKQFGEKEAQQPSDKGREKFHESLKREEAITSRQQELLSDLIRDAPFIREQIAKRRAEIAANIESLQSNGGDSQSNPELGNLQKIQRSYDSISERLERLKDNPAQADWVRRIVRGIFAPEDFDGQMASQALRRLQQLEQEQGDLKKRIEQLDSQISDLRDILESVGSQSGGGRMGSPGRGRTWGTNVPPPGGPNAPPGVPPPGGPGSFPPGSGGENERGRMPPPPPR